jgi:hypothetical protein
LKLLGLFGLIFSTAALAQMRDLEGRREQFALWNRVLNTLSN